MADILEITKSEGNGFTIMRLKGRLESVTSTSLAQAVEGWKQSAHGGLMFDCRDLAYVSSAGLRVFLTCGKQGKAEGWNFALFGPQAVVMDVLRISGFDRILNVYADEPSAVAALST